LRWDYAVHFCIDYRAVNVYSVPSLEALKKEGEQGKRKINQYTRYGTLFLALVQGVGCVLV
jgi:preprotein translocase subunit SecY